MTPIIVIRKSLYQPDNGFWQSLNLDGIIILGMFLLSLIALVNHWFLPLPLIEQGKAILLVVCAWVLLIMTAQIIPERLLAFGWFLYGCGLLLLLLTLFFGAKINGAQRWLSIDDFRFQPSALLLTALPLTIVYFLQNVTITLARYMAALLLILTPAVLVLLEPDLGSAVLILLIGFITLSFFKTPKRYLVFTFLAFMVFLPLLTALLHQYQKDRFFDFVTYWSDHTGPYQLQQLHYFLHHASWWGATDLAIYKAALIQHVPGFRTDLVLDVFIWQFGYLAAIVLLLIFLGLGWRSHLLSQRSHTPLYRRLVGALYTMIFLQVIIGYAMVMEWLPFAGLPFPFLSLSGSALLPIFINFGVIQSCLAHEHRVINE